MIVREQKDDIVMIKQHDHGLLAGTLFTKFNKEYLPSSDYKEDLFFAIRNHDCGWKLFDEEPFWNDQNDKPYDFNDFPIGPKLVLYEFGINKVEKTSLFAALLCSIHYVSFLRDRTDEASKQFVQNELFRQKRIQQEELNLDEQFVKKHYQILKLFDDLSLYLCLNEPDTTKEDEHFFFQNGIQLPTLFGRDRLEVNWKTNDTLFLSEALFYDDLTVKLQQKVVEKEAISKLGIKKAYAKTEEEIVSITLKVTS